jgi:hypothetical protein
MKYSITSHQTTHRARRMNRQSDQHTQEIAMKKILCLTLSILTSLFIRAEAGERNTLAFPSLAKTAQSMALGEGAANLTGLNALGSNPAGLAAWGKEFLTQYQPMALDTNMVMAGLSVPVARLGTTFAASYFSLRSADFDKRNEFGDQGGKFSSEDRIASLHAGRPFDIAAGILAIGAGAKYIQMRTDSFQGTTVAGDLGARLNFKNRPLSLGLSLMDIGRPIALNGTPSRLPARLSLSSAYRLGNLTLVSGFTQNLNESRRDMSMGAEFGMGGLLTLRGQYGLKQGSAGQGSGLQNLTGGVGLKLFHGSTLDYAFQPFDETLRQTGAAGMHRMTMIFHFGDTRGGK